MSNFSIIHTGLSVYSARTITNRQSRVWTLLCAHALFIDIVTVREPLLVDGSKC